jgi:hypothetical protein
MELSRLFVSHGVDDRPPDSGIGTGSQAGYSIPVSASGGKGGYDALGGGSRVKAGCLDTLEDKVHVH